MIPKSVLGQDLLNIVVNRLLKIELITIYKEKCLCLLLNSIAKSLESLLYLIETCQFCCFLSYIFW